MADLRGHFDQVEGAAATNASAAGNPVRTGVVVTTAAPVKGSNGNVRDPAVDLRGRLNIVHGAGNPPAPVYINATSTGDVTILSAAGSGQSWYIQRILIINQGASAIDCNFQASGTTTNRGPGYLGAGPFGVVMDFGAAGWEVGNNLGLDLNIPSGTPDIHVTVLAHYNAAI